MQSGLLHPGRRKPEATDDDVMWGPFPGEAPRLRARAAKSGDDRGLGSLLRLMIIIAIAAFGAIAIVPVIVAAFIAPFHGGLLIQWGFIAVTILGFVLIASNGLSRLSKARNTAVRLPAIRDPVRDAAMRKGLVHRGVLTPARNDRLHALAGDVHTALALPGQGESDRASDMPDEFHGTFPDGSPFWCLIRKSNIPLAGVPEHHLRPGKDDPDATSQMLTMLVAFPQHRRTGLRLEILHRFMQVRFARIATTLDTGSSEFNMRFFVAARGVEDLVPVFRIVTPALQTLLISLFERFWLVNLVISDNSAFLSAVAFSPQDAAPEDHALWVGAALDDCIAGAARAKTYLD